VKEIFSGSEFFYLSSVLRGQREKGRDNRMRGRIFRERIQNANSDGRGDYKKIMGGGNGC